MADGRSAEKTTTLTLDEYERANLLWLLHAVGYPWDQKNPTVVEPFNMANTGDWVGQVVGKLGFFEDPPTQHPNRKLQDLKRSCEAWRNDKDRLKEMWSQQKDFMYLLCEERSFPKFPTDITSKAGQQFLEGISFHLMKELFEAGLHLKNSKSHRATEIKEVDRDAYKEELVDVLHLFFEICIAAGINLEELYDAYMKKGIVNFERIRNGY